jgi:hypothetical protein
MNAILGKLELGKFEEGGTSASAAPVPTFPVDAPYSRATNTYWVKGS